MNVVGEGFIPSLHPIGNDGEERVGINYDHPDALDNDLLIEHLDQLPFGQRQPPQRPENIRRLATR